MQRGRPASCSFLHSFPSMMDSHPYRTISQKKSSLIPPPRSKENRTQPKVKPGAENLACVIPQSVLVPRSSVPPTPAPAPSGCGHMSGCFIVFLSSILGTNSRRGSDGVPTPSYVSGSPPGKAHPRPLDPCCLILLASRQEPGITCWVGQYPLTLPALGLPGLWVT